MKALILAGGQAKRLNPITDNLPKALIKIDDHGNCIIDNQIESLLENNIKEVLIITGFESEKIRKHLQKYSDKIHITYIHNDQYKETKPSYAFWIAKEHLTTPFIYLNGDVVFDPQILKEVLDDKRDAVTVIQRNDWDVEEVNVVINKDGYINTISKNINDAESHGEFIGITKIGHHFLQSFIQALEAFEEKGEKNRFAVDVINLAIREYGGLLHAKYADEFLATEVDTAEDFFYAQKIWEKIQSKQRTVLPPPYVKVIGAIKLLLCWFWHTLSYIIPKNKNGIVFSGWHTFRDRETFADNAKYLFLHLCQTQAHLDTTWITKDRRLLTTLNQLGYSAAYMYSLRGIWKALRARYKVVDALVKREQWQFSGKSKFIQLWHGRAIKDIHIHPDTTLLNKFVLPNKYVRFDTITASSKYGVELMKQIFSQAEQDIPITGFPRNDIFFKEIKHSDIDSDTVLVKLIETKKETDKKHKFILYAPTFRRASKQIDISTFFLSQKLSDWLTKNNCTLLLSFHPKYKGQLRHQVFQNIIPAQDKDIYPILKRIDMLVTDYSSSFVDFLLTDKPMVFFAYDLNEYQKKEGISVDYKSHMPGHIAENETKLMASIEEAFTHDPYKEKRRATRDLYHTYQDGNSAERVLRAIFKKDGV